jgi:hypothetical protein
MSSAKPMGTEASDVSSMNDDWRLYVMGWVRYTDNREVIRYTGFCRQWRHPERRFRAIDDPDYEYAD